MGYKGPRGATGTYVQSGHDIFGTTKCRQGHQKASEGGADVIDGMECFSSAHYSVIHNLWHPEGIEQQDQ